MPTTDLSSPRATRFPGGQPGQPGSDITIDLGSATLTLPLDDTLVYEQP